MNRSRTLFRPVDAHRKCLREGCYTLLCDRGHTRRDRCQESLKLYSESLSVRVVTLATAWVTPYCALTSILSH